VVEGSLSAITAIQAVAFAGRKGIFAIERQVVRKNP
jgi:hypothetical protein